MTTKWELVIRLARRLDADCAAGRHPDFTSVSLLLRELLDFHAQLAPGVASAGRAATTTGSPGMHVAATNRGGERT